MSPTSGAFVSDPVGIGLITTHPGDGPPRLARSWPGAAFVVVKDASDRITVDTIAGCAGAELVVCGRSLSASVTCGCGHGVAFPLRSGLVASEAIGRRVQRPGVQAIGQCAARVVDLVVVIFPLVASGNWCDLPHAAHDVVGGGDPMPRWEAVRCIVKKADLVQNCCGNRGVVLRTCCFKHGAVLEGGCGR